MATMINKFFSHNLIRSYVIGFGSLFDHIVVVRFNADGTPNNQVTVPLRYGPREKFVERNEQDPDFSRSFAMVYPRMTFDLKGMTYDSGKKTTSLAQVNTLAGGANPSTGSYVYTSSPWNLSFSLLITAKSADEAAQIVEQIVPFFTPDYVVKINTVPEQKIVDSCSVVLDSISYADSYDGSFTDRRVIEWEIMFTMKCNFYGATRTGPVITAATFDVDGDGTTVDTTQVSINDTGTQDVIPRVVDYINLIQNRGLLNDYGFTEPANSN